MILRESDGEEGEFLTMMSESTCDQEGVRIATQMCKNA
jgi:hypothetical protein